MFASENKEILKDLEELDNLQLKAKKLEWLKK